MRHLFFVALMLVAGLAAVARSASADVWISPGQSKSVVCWSVPFGTPTQRINFANITGPGTTYRVTVSKAGWTSGWPWAWWSWTNSYSPLAYSPSTVSANFTTSSGVDYHLELRGMEGVGYATCVVTLNRVTNAMSAAPAEVQPTTPAGGPSQDSPAGTRTSWGKLKARYR